MDNFKIIYKILKHLEAGMDCDVIDIGPITHDQLRISYERWERLLIMLQSDGYITGLKCSRTLSEDKEHLVQPVKPLITLKGLEYLLENTIMHKVASFANGVKDSIPGI